MEDCKYNYKDLLILAELRKNSRASYADIAKKAMMPSSTVFDRIKSLKRKVIKRHIPIIDFQKMGFGFHILYIIKTEREDMVRNFFLKHKNVNTVSRTKNRGTYFIEAVFKDIKDMHSFAEDVSLIGDVDTDEHHISESEKTEGFLTNEEHARSMMQTGL